MQTIRIIPYKYWQHTSGRKASLFGACPWNTEADKGNWEFKISGFTWELTDSRGNTTVGLGRVPADTREAALRFAHEYARAIGNVKII